MNRRNCILVYKIPRSIVEDDLRVHFQARSRGGGDIDTVLLNRKLGQARIIFHDDTVAASVVTYTHILAGTQLVVKPMPPEVFLDKEVEVEIDPYWTELLGHQQLRSLLEAVGSECGLVVRGSQPCFVRGKLYKLYEIFHSLREFFTLSYLDSPCMYRETIPDNLEDKGPTGNKTYPHREPDSSDSLKGGYSHDGDLSMEGSDEVTKREISNKSEQFDRNPDQGTNLTYWDLDDMDPTHNINDATIVSMETNGASDDATIATGHINVTSSDKEVHRIFDTNDSQSHPAENMDRMSRKTHTPSQETSTLIDSNEVESPVLQFPEKYTCTLASENSVLVHEDLYRYITQYFKEDIDSVSLQNRVEIKTAGQTSSGFKELRFDVTDEKKYSKTEYENRAVNAFCELWSRFEQTFIKEEIEIPKGTPTLPDTLSELEKQVPVFARQRNASTIALLGLSDNVIEARLHLQRTLFRDDNSENEGATGGMLSDVVPELQEASGIWNGKADYQSLYFPQSNHNDTTLESRQFSVGDTEGANHHKSGGRSKNTLMTYNSDIDDPIMCKKDRLEFRTKNGLHVYVYQANIVDQSTTVIVNSANGYLNHGAGVAAAIAKAAGHRLVSYCDRYIQKKGPMKTTEVMHSTAGNLPNQHVIHAVGPRASDYKKFSKCYADLQKTFMNVLVYANGTLEASSLSLPAIGAGLFGVPKDKVADAMFHAIIEFDHLKMPDASHKRLSEIRIVNIDDATNEAMVTGFKRLLGVADRQEARLHAQTDSTNPNTAWGIDRNIGGSGQHESDFTRQKDDEQLSVHSKTKTEDFNEENGKERGHQFLPTRTSEGEDDRWLSPHQHGRGPESDSFHTKTSRNFKADRGTAQDDHWLSTRQHERGPKSDTFQTKTSGNFKGNRGTAHQGNDSKHRKGKTSGKRDTKINIGEHDWKDTNSKKKVEDNTSTKAQSATNSAAAKKEEEQCVICMDDLSSGAKALSCGHKFHKDCIDQQFKYKPVCPVCNTIHGRMTGNQPPGGSMRVRQDWSSLPGYEGSSTNVITYNIPGGTQTDGHPHPGKRYHGTTRIAYLPDNREGKEVLELLREAFDRRLVFTVGRSSTTGQDNAVTWNDIHHKTNRTGGPERYGYPDATYLNRVKEELAAKGVTLDSLKKQKHKS